MTPDELAVAVVTALDARPSTTWLEPSHGEGVFIRAIRAAGFPRKQIRAIDLDPVKSDSDRLAMSQRGRDFLDPSVFPRSRFDFIVGNPPYLAIERLRGVSRDWAAKTLDPDGKPIGANANIWYAFLCKSMRLLKSGGSMGFVLPAASEFTDYSRPGRDAIRRHFDQVQIFRFEESPFSDVLDGPVILLARRFSVEPQKRIADFQRVRCTSVSDFLGRASLGRGVSRSSRCPSPSGVRAGQSLISDIAAIRIGAVTGDARYFLMTESRRRELGLPKSAFAPALTRAKHLALPSLTNAVYQRLLEQNERVLLFSPKGKSLSHKRVKQYLSLPRVDGGCNRTAAKIVNREPWYLTPRVPAPDGFVSGMVDGVVHITLNRMPALCANNTLFQVHLRNPVGPVPALPLAIALVTPYAQNQIRRLRREYAGGLKKLEPGDIGRIRLPWPICSPSLSGYNRAVRLFRTGNPGKANSIIEEMM